MRIISPKRLLESVAPTVRNGSIFNASSLDLQFARTKTLDPRITFTRTSSGTYVGSDGLIKTATTNEARFDHNPTTGESLGLLVEEPRTNLLLRSEEFDNASWSPIGLASVAANSTAAPNGTTTADAFVETSGVSETHRALQTVSVTSGVSYASSVFAKQDQRRYCYLIFSPNMTWNNVNTIAYFDLQTGVVVSAANCTATITAFPNGWYRCTATATATATNAAALVGVGASTNGTAQTYTGNGSNAIAVWGAQLEAGSFPTSYIPTTTATVTRSADVASITGANFSSWYNQTEGTVFVEGRSPATSASYLAFSDNSSNNRILYDTISTGTSRRLVVTSGGAQQAALNHTGGVEQMLKSSFVYKADDFIACTSSALSSADTSGTVPTVDRMYVGSNASGALPTNGVLRRLTYWPSRLPNATLQQITR